LAENRFNINTHIARSCDFTLEAKAKPQ